MLAERQHTWYTVLRIHSGMKPVPGNFIGKGSCRSLPYSGPVDQHIGPAVIRSPHRLIEIFQCKVFLLYIDSCAVLLDQVLTFSENVMEGTQKSGLFKDLFQFPIRKVIQFPVAARIEFNLPLNGVIINHSPCFFQAGRIDRGRGGFIQAPFFPGSFVGSCQMVIDCRLGQTIDIF